MPEYGNLVAVIQGENIDDFLKGVAYKEGIPLDSMTVLVMSTANMTSRPGWNK